MNNGKEIKHCGGCAFLIGEDMYGYGSCPFDFGELKHCEMAACQNHIDRDKVRHSAAVLAQFKRFSNVPIRDWDKFCRPKDGEIDEAIDTITRYVNVITKKV